MYTEHEMSDAIMKQNIKLAKLCILFNAHSSTHSGEFAMCQLQVEVDGSSYPHWEK